MSKDGKLDEALQGHLGAQLRKMYDQDVQEPLPERFTALLDDLDRAFQKRSPTTDSQGKDK